MRKAFGFAILAALVFIVPSPAQSPSPRVLWTFAGPANPGYEWVTLAAVDNGLVFAVGPGETWNFTTENGAFKETGSTITALDLRNGSKVWAAESRWPILSPLLVVSGRLVAYNGYGEVLCFSARDGKPLWKVEAELHPGSWDEQTLPTARGERVFLREKNEIVCRSLRDGRAVWRTEVESVQNRRVHAAPAGDRLVVANSMDAVLGLDMASGKILWRKKIDAVGADLTAGPGFALAADGDRTIALDPADGREIWTCGRPALPNGRSISAKSPVWNLEKVAPLAAIGDRVLLYQKKVRYPDGQSFSLEAALYDRAALRDQIWSLPLGSDFQGLCPAGPLILSVEGGTLSAWNAVDGRKAWEFRLPGEGRLQGQPLAADGKILVIGKKGLTCLETGDPRLTGWSQSGGPARLGESR
jgi:outer membrane protein assembly factor BamB